jgi:hypothetical protein
MEIDAFTCVYFRTASGNAIFTGGFLKYAASGFHRQFS